jgi:hypothetical protein
MEAALRALADPSRRAMVAAHLGGRERGAEEARWAELVPPYQELAAHIR